MKKFLCLLVMALGFTAGCGEKPADTSQTPPPKATEDTSQEIQSAMDSGKIDPATYGKESK